ncbi:MAG: hypothetical protein Q4D30_11150 [Bacteroidales bacterium]|nr:hypothetical protein [Bacteroidales bacterium]
MKQKKLWMLAAILTICGAVTGVVACDKANAQVDNPAPAVKSTELIRTLQSCKQNRRKKSPAVALGLYLMKYSIYSSFASDANVL